jgi:hypothetical protein
MKLAIFTDCEWLKEHPFAYRERCKWGQTSARQSRDWSVVVGDWVGLLE